MKDKVFVLTYNSMTTWGTPYVERSVWHKVENARAAMDKRCPLGDWKSVSVNIREHFDGSKCEIEVFDFSD